jgi:hypothetical protein
MHGLMTIQRNYIQPWQTGQVIHNTHYREHLKNKDMKTLTVNIPDELYRERSQEKRSRPGRTVGRVRA